MSAMDHSKIESANDPEARSIEAEASRIACRAAEALRLSRAACQNVAVNVPTWTGRSGTMPCQPLPERGGQRAHLYGAVRFGHVRADWHVGVV